ncbi:MAG: serine protease Do [Chthoniobacter sp.]|jgi:hypothetical protein|nr:serine protease Do [Chthoniobacter sp.]
MNQPFRRLPLAVAAAALLAIFPCLSARAASSTIQIGPANIKITTPDGSVHVTGNAGASTSEPGESYLGVATSAVGREVRERLGLPKGFYLRVDAVEPGSPAERAGVRSGDVLTKFGDQMLVNPEQLRVLVRSQKPGGTVPLTLLREGEPVSVSVQFEEKAVASASPIPGLQFDQPGAGAGAWLSIGPEGVHISTEKMPDELKKLAESIKGLSEIDGDKLGDQLKQQLQEALGGIADVDVNLAKSNRARSKSKRSGNSEIVVNDDDLEFKLTRDKDGQHLRAKSRNGRVLYDGPLDTAADWDKLPPELRRKVEEVQGAAEGR